MAACVDWEEGGLGPAAAALFTRRNSFAHASSAISATADVCRVQVTADSTTEEKCALKLAEVEVCRGTPLLWESTLTCGLV